MAIVLSLFLISMVFAVSAVPIDSHDITFVSHTYDPGTDTSTWTYQVTSGSSPAISHWTMAWCIPDAIVDSSDPEATSYVDPDPSTGLTGIKFNRGYENYEVRTVWFTLSGDYPEGDVTVAIKAGLYIGYGTVTGPLCVVGVADVAIEKTGVEYAHEGDLITYHYKVTNYGPGTAVNVHVIDDMLGDGIPIDLTGYLPDNTLDPLEVNEFDFTYNVPTPSGDITNTVTVTSTTPDTNLTNNQDSWTVDVLHPGIAVEKTGPTYAHDWDVITYTITVTNTGDCDLFSVSVVDSLLGTIYSDGLLYGQTLTFPVSYTVDPADGDPLVNTVTASGQDALGLGVSDTASWTVDVLHPGIAVEKTGPTYAHDGDVITYTITVTNTGDCPLFSVSVTDSLLGTIYSDGLGVGEVVVRYVDYLVPTPSDDVYNTVIASGVDSLGGYVEDSDDHYVDVLHPGIEVTKTANATLVVYCDSVEYTVTVENTGDCPLEVVLSDPLVTISWTGTLGPGEVHTETKVFHPEDDTINTATASGTDALGLTVADEDSWTVYVARIEKTLSQDYGYLGDVITVTLNVKVPNRYTMTVRDELPRGLPYIPGTFKVDGVPVTPTVEDRVISTEVDGGVHVITFDVQIDSVEATSETLTNWAYLIYDTDIVDQDSADITTHPYEGFIKEAILVSTEDGDEIIEVGEEVVWNFTITVTNLYDWTMIDATVTDRLAAELEVDEVLYISTGECTFTYESQGKGKKTVAATLLTWAIGDLEPGETATLKLQISTALNPDGRQEYTSPEHYELNSGATLKFIHPETGIQLSACTEPIEIDVEGEDDPPKGKKPKK